MWLTTFNAFAEEQDKELYQAQERENATTEQAQMMEDGDTFPSSGGGGVPTPSSELGLHPSLILDRVSEADEADYCEQENETEENDVNDDGSSEEIVRGTGHLTQSGTVEEPLDRIEPDVEMDAIQQPLPFQMGLTPQPDEVPSKDGLTDWYEENQSSEARGSTEHPMPKAKAIN